jgi:hypothetical protein
MNYNFCLRILGRWKMPDRSSAISDLSSSNSLSTISRMPSLSNARDWLQLQSTWDSGTAVEGRYMRNRGPRSLSRDHPACQVEALHLSEFPRFLEGEVVGVHKLEEVGNIEDVLVTHSPKIFEKDPIERLRQTVDSNRDIQLVSVEVIDFAQVVV